MDLLTEASLEALIYKATDARNKGIDNSAVDAFCGIINKMPESSYKASKLVAERIQSPDEWEALQGLSVLETCMRKCGPSFHCEVGKFRFLNEMIKLVSPKYLGPRTSPKVRDIAIKLLHSWAVLYTKEPKIKEAYEMLKKQGVVTDEVPRAHEGKPAPTPSKSNIPVDHEFESKLKKLLNSKNPEDLEAANRMIKSRVMETERRSTELERVRTNVRLLADMVAISQPGTIPQEDLQLMSEIYSECERLRPVVFRLAGETQDSDTLTDILNLSEELSQVFEKYSKIVSHKGLDKNMVPSALLDFSSPVQEKGDVPVIPPAKPVNDFLGDASPVLALNSPSSSLNTLSLLPPPSTSPVVSGNDMDQLGAIFGVLNTSTLPSSLIAVSKPACIQSVPTEKTNKQKALDELDVLGESLLQQCKNDIQQYKEPESKLAINEVHDEEIMDFAGPKSLDEVMLRIDEPSSANDSLPLREFTNGEPLTEINSAPNEPIRALVTQVKPLTDISVTLDKITPSDVPPLRILDATNGIGLTVHLARDSPREDVSAYVVTTTSTSNLPLSDYLFQVVVPKMCKFKLLPPSTTSLPAHNPFLPPAAITQVLLIANPNGLKLNLTFMMSFTREDEPVTQVGEITELPSLKKINSEG